MEEFQTRHLDLSGHPDAETVNAKATMKRITDDCEYYAERKIMPRPQCV